MGEITMMRRPLGRQCPNPSISAADCLALGMDRGASGTDLAGLTADAGHGLNASDLRRLTVTGET